MKRIGLPAAVMLMFLLTYAPRAFAVCQSCPGMGSLSAQCYTLGMCERGATMSACVLMDHTVGDTVTYRYCDSFGTSAGAECNGNDMSCANGGGGVGGGGGGGGGGGCTISGGETCPADCSSCNNEDLFYQW